MKRKLRITCILLVCLLLFSLSLSAESPVVMDKEEIQNLVRAHTLGIEASTPDVASIPITQVPVISSLSADEIKTLTRDHAALSAHAPICVHNYRYYSLDAKTHVAICFNCSYVRTEKHLVVDASCTHNQHCVLCAHHTDDRENRLDHAIGIVPNYLEGTHTYRCIRRDSDGEYSCDLIEATFACSWGNTYVDSPTNGEHYIWRECSVCSNMDYLGSYPCTFPDYCNYPH